MRTRIENKKHSPVASMRAQAIAVLLVGPIEAPALKDRWDSRQSFYPQPSRRAKRGQPHYFAPADLILAAATAGDASGTQVVAALQALKCMAECRPELP